MLFPTPVLRPMTAATVGIVSAPPVMSRNSVITAAPARIFPIRKNPATAMRAPIVINDKKDADVLCMSASQTVDKLGVGCYAQHHFSFKTSFLFIFFKINKNLAVFQPRFSRIFASFFKFMHAKVSPAFISIRAFPTYCVYRNPCCSLAVPKIRSMVSFLNW